MYRRTHRQKQKGNVLGALGRSLARGSRAQAWGFKSSQQEGQWDHHVGLRKSGRASGLHRIKTVRERLLPRGGAQHARPRTKSTTA